MPVTFCKVGQEEYFIHFSKNSTPNSTPFTGTFYADPQVKFQFELPDNDLDPDFKFSPTWISAELASKIIECVMKHHQNE